MFLQPQRDFHGLHNSTSRVRVVATQVWSSVKRDEQRRHIPPATANGTKRRISGRVGRCGNCHGYQGWTWLKISTGKQFIKWPGLAFVRNHWLLAPFTSSRLPICYDNILKLYCSSTVVLDRGLRLAILVFVFQVFSLHHLTVPRRFAWSE